MKDEKSARSERMDDDVVVLNSDGDEEQEQRVVLKSDVSTLLALGKENTCKATHLTVLKSHVLEQRSNAAVTEAEAELCILKEKHSRDIASAERNIQSLKHTALRAKALHTRLHSDLHATKPNAGATAATATAPAAVPPQQLPPRPAAPAAPAVPAAPVSPAVPTALAAPPQRLVTAAHAVPVTSAPTAMEVAYAQFMAETTSGGGGDAPAQQSQVHDEPWPVHRYGVSAGVSTGVSAGVSAGVSLAPLLQAIQNAAQTHARGAAEAPHTRPHVSVFMPPPPPRYPTPYSPSPAPAVETLRRAGGLMRGGFHTSYLPR